MSPSIWQLLLVVVVIFVIFGAGKLPKVMGDLGKGVKNMRDGLKGEADKASDEMSVKDKKPAKGKKK